jgi:heme/copper-type cytochrome/quinol oxidase subunit 2
MNAATAPSSPMHRQPHPSPHRAKVGALPIWFAIVAAPLAWNLQLLFNVGLVAHGCYPHDEPRSEPIWNHLATATTAIEVIAIVVCVVAGLVAWRNWRRTREEAAGSAHHLIEGGDGRTRFMAMVGILCSGLFGLAVLFSAAMLAVVPPCSG